MTLSSILLIFNNTLEISFLKKYYLEHLKSKNKSSENKGQKTSH
jgi:hypothetical protein